MKKTYPAKVSHLGLRCRQEAMFHIYAQRGGTIWTRMNKKGGEDKKKEFMVPYWWVRSTEDSESANMAESSVQVAVEGNKVSVPVLKNFKKVAANECLFILKKQAEGGTAMHVAKAAASASKAAGAKKAPGKGKKGKGRSN